MALLCEHVCHRLSLTVNCQRNLWASLLFIQNLYSCWPFKEKELIYMNLWPIVALRAQDLDNLVIMAEIKVTGGSLVYRVALRAFFWFVQRVQIKDQ